MFNEKYTALFIDKYESLNTKRNYLNDLKLFDTYLSNNKCNFDKINNEIVINFKKYLIEKKMQKNSIRRILITLKNYFNFLMKMNVINVNPFYIIKMPKADRESKTTYLKKEKIEEIFKHLKSKIDKKKEYTKYSNLVFYLIFYLFIYHGLRLSEIVSIKLSDIDFKSDIPIIKIQGKGNVTREQPLRQDFIELLNTYIIKYNINNWLFPALKNKDAHISSVTVYRKISYLGFLFEEDLYPHKLRHFAITQCLENNIDLNTVKNFAGHKSIETTLRYDRRKKNISESPVLKLNYSDK